MNRSSSAHEAIVNCFIAVAAVAANSPQQLQLHFIVMSFRHRTLHITSHPMPCHAIPSPFASSYFMTQTGVAKFTSPRECSGLANKPTNQFARCLGAQNPSFPPKPNPQSAIYNPKPALWLWLWLYLAATFSFISLLVEIYEPRARELERRSKKCAQANCFCSAGAKSCALGLRLPL